MFAIHHTARARRAATVRLLVAAATVVVLARSARAELNLVPYKPNYIVHNLGDLSDDQIKFQISFSTCVLEPLNLHLAYTQRSFWNLYDRNPASRYHAYNPELFVRLSGIGIAPDILSRAQIGWEHESNGNGHAWERAYSEVRVQAGKRLRLDTRLWYVVEKGYFSSGIDAHTWLGGPFGVTVDAVAFLRDGVTFRIEGIPVRYSSFELAYRVEKLVEDVFRVHSGRWTDAELLVQVWEGYGEGLQNLDAWSRTVGVGIRLFAY